MILATLIAASIVSLAAGVVSLVKAGKGCAPHKRSFRIVSALVWFTLSALWIVALTGEFYIIRSGILTRLLIALQAMIYIGELLLEPSA
jgi:hypothetical protein